MYLSNITIFKFISFFLFFSMSQAFADSKDDNQHKQYLGHGRLFTNDFLGDGKDRWRTGSLSSSFAWGSVWKGQLPNQYAELFEVQVLSEIIAPSDLSGKRGIDRPFAGHLQFGILNHFERAGIGYSLGAGVSVLGEKTGLDDFQIAVHKALGEKLAADDVRNSQVKNQLRIGPLFELSKSVSENHNVLIRPFFAAHSTAETLVRVGTDVYFGTGFSNALYSRDQVTGQRYHITGIAQETLGFSIGGDISQVAHSAFFDGSETPMNKRRLRFRTGLHWGHKTKQGFAGLTWLSKEFSGQPEGQILGSVRLILRF